MTCAAAQATTGNRFRPSGGVFSGGSGWDLTKKFSQWTYAAEAENVVVGYLTGCPDSRGFTKAKLWRFALPLLVDICRGHYSENRDVQQHYNQGIRLYREEKLEPAIAEWPTVLQHDPNHEGHGPQCRKQQSILFH